MLPGADGSISMMARMPPGDRIRYASFKISSAAGAGNS